MVLILTYKSLSEQALADATDEVNRNAHNLASTLSQYPKIFPDDAIPAHIERDLSSRFAIKTYRPVTVHDGKASISTVLFARAWSGGGFFYGDTTVRMCVRYEVALGSASVTTSGEPCPPEGPERNPVGGTTRTTVTHEP